MNTIIQNYIDKAKEQQERAEQALWEAECEHTAWCLLQTLAESDTSLFSGDFPITLDDFLSKLDSRIRKQNPRACDIAWAYYNHLVY